MFNVNTIKTAFSGMIGLRNTNDPDYPISTLTGASEYVYFNDYHPLITFENLYSIAPNYDAFDYSTWTATGYSTGSYVKYDRIVYKAQRTMLNVLLPSTVWPGCWVNKVFYFVLFSNIKYWSIDTDR